VTCAEVLRELAEKLAAKLAFSDRQVDETLADYLSFQPLSFPSLRREQVLACVDHAARLMGNRYSLERVA